MKDESEGKEPKDDETRPAEGPEVGGFHVGKIVYSCIQQVVNDKQRIAARDFRPGLCCEVGNGRPVARGPIPMTALTSYIAAHLPCNCSLGRRHGEHNLYISCGETIEHAQRSCRADVQHW